MFQDLKAKLVAAAPTIRRRALITAGAAVGIAIAAVVVVAIKDEDGEVLAVTES